MSKWHKVGIELPEGWNDHVADLARAAGCPMRYVWIAALDRFLAQEPDAAAELARKVSQQAESNVDAIRQSQPGGLMETRAEVEPALVASI